MKLYHGSKFEIKEVKYQGSSFDNDYGPAFYLTKDEESAHEWACRNNSIGFVNEYEFNIDGLKVLDLRKESILSWLAILMHFRKVEQHFLNSFAFRLEFLEKNYFINVNDYDAVIGYRADDAYFRFPLDFIRGNLTLNQLEESFQLGKMGIQYALISQKATSHLKYIASYKSNEKYINQYFNKVNTATRRLDLLSKDIDGTRIMDIMKK